MAFRTSNVRTPIGMRASLFFPIASEPANARPVYETEVDMGTAVKGYLSVATVTGEIVGDDVTQLDAEMFASGTLDVETTMSDLQVNATLYGHSYTELDGEVSNSSDIPTPGGYAYVEPILLKDRTTVFRTSIYPKVCAVAASEKSEADTKKPSEFSPKMTAVQFKVSPDARGDWRIRSEYETLEAAMTAIRAFFRGNA